MTNNARFRNLFAIIPACIILLAGCSGEKGKPKETGGDSDSPAKPLSVSTATVTGRTVQRAVETTGTLQPWEDVVVSSETSGTVIRIAADLGDKVRAGDILAELDRREAALNLEDAEATLQTNVKTAEKEKARLIDAETTLKRYDELYKSGMVSASQHDGVKTAYDVARAAFNEATARMESSAAKVSIAKKRLSDTVIKAPISGEISKRFASVGEAVKDKTGLFMVVSSGNLKFRGTIPEIAVPHVRPGQGISVSVEAFPNRVFNGTVKRVSPAVSAETRSLDVEAVVPNADGVLRPGFFASGSIFTKKDDGVPFAPSGAVYTFAGVTKVFVITEGAASERIVKTGAREADLIELIGDIKPGDVLASSNLANLYNGARVAPGGK